MKKKFIVKFSGSVHGVGFRFTTEIIAKRLGICGYVKNCFDGTVELTVECAQEEFDKLLSEIKQQMKRYISEIKINESEPTDGFTEFIIRQD